MHYSNNQSQKGVEFYDKRRIYKKRFDGICIQRKIPTDVQS